MSGLTDADIDSFVERGFLLVPGCFDRAWAKERVRETLVAGTPPARVRRKGELFVGLPDYRDPATWGADRRLDVETGQSFPIDALAPRLWEVIRALVGPKAHITRRVMGTQWVVAPNTTAPDRPSLEERFDPGPAVVVPGPEGGFSGRSWHIDTPGPATTLDGRHDALTLLILWTDFPERGGGTLYSGESLTHVVRYLEERPEGCDTRDDSWANALAEQCGDIQELRGRAGDVLVTHSLSLHSAQTTQPSAFRVLENPTITVEQPLRYDTDVTDPSLVERAVHQRLRGPRPRRWEETTLLALVADQPALFLPGQRAWMAERDAGQRERVMQMCEALLAAWVSDQSKRIRLSQRDVPLRCAEAAVGLVRQLLLDHISLQLPLPSPRPEAPGLLFCELVRGFVHADVSGRLIALLLAPIVDDVRLVAVDGRTLPILQQEGTRILVDPRAATPLFALDASGPAHDLPLLDSATMRALEGTPRLPVPGLDGVRHTPPEVRRGAEPSTDVWTAFLRVRAHHLLNAKPKPGAYASLLETHRTQGMTKRVIEAFSRSARR